MFVIVAVALFGALLGLSMRPAPRAILVAAGSVAAFQCAAIGLSHLLLHRSGMEGLAWSVQRYAGSAARDLIPLASTAAFAAARAAIVAAATRSGEQRRRAKRVAAIPE